jgi:lipoprotein-releasing system ATP-binding protein
MGDNHAKLLLACRGLGKTYHIPGTKAAKARSLDVLKGVDLDINRGEMVSIVGQSGVGKSTLLQIIGTLDRPSKGSVTYEGEDVFAFNEKRLSAFRNQHIGFIFQFHHLLAEFSASENVMLPQLIHGISRKEAAQEADAILIDLGLKERLLHKPGELSGGEQQRVAIARALIMKPSIVFADEPTGNLDTQTSDEIHHLLVALNERLAMAFVVVTHNVRLAWLMKRHLLLKDGAVRELADDEAPEEFLPQRGDEAA